MLRSALLLVCISLLASPALGQGYSQPQLPAQAPSHITWLQSIDQARQIAQQTGRLVLVHFWAPDCAPCVRLEQTVYAYANVAQRIQARFVPVKVNSQQFPMVARQYEVTSWPKDVILAPGGQVVAVLSCPQDQAAYLAGLESAIAAADPKLASPYANLTAGQPAVMPPQGMSPATAPAASSIPGIPDRYAEYFRDRQPTPAVTGGPPATPGPTVQPQVVQMQSNVPQPAPSVVFPMSSTQPNPNGTAAAPGPPGPWGVNGGQPYSGGAGQVLAPTIPPVSTPAATMMAQGQRPQTNVGPVSAPPIAVAPPAASMALDGCCAVTLVEGEKWVRGDKRFGAVHRGQTYLFAGPEQQKRFLANPDHYSPALSGADPVLAIESRQTVAGQRKHGLFYNNRVYLFSSETTLNQFGRDPRRYADGVRMAEAGGQGPLR